jgi:hypothetical protein
VGVGGGGVHARIVANAPFRRVKAAATRLARLNWEG